MSRWFVVASVCAVSACTGCDAVPPAGSSVVSSAPSSALVGSDQAGGGTLAAARKGVAGVPFSGTLDGSYGAPDGEFPIFVETITGSGRATHLGPFTLKMVETVDVSRGTATGTFIFTAANGDTLDGSYDGEGKPAGALFSIVERADITGGTGRFAGAAGHIEIKRLFDMATGTTTGSFDGSLIWRAE